MGGSGIVFQISFEGFHRLVIFSEVVFRRTEYTVHLSRMGLAGIGGQIILCNDFRLVVVFLDQIDFRDVIRYQRFIFGTILQGKETAEGFVIPSLGIADVREVITAVRRILLAGAAQGLEPDGGFLYIAGFQVAGGQAVGHVIPFFGT